MDEELDALLKQPLLDVPAGFEARVMAAVALRPAPARTTWWGWLAVLTGAALGAWQVLGFALGVWLTASAHG